MKKFFSKLFIIFLNLLFAIQVVACSDSSSATVLPDMSSDRVYTSVSIEFYDPQFYYQIENVIYYQDYYYVFLVEVNKDKTDDFTYYINKIDSEGNIQSQIELSKDCELYFTADIKDGVLYYVAYNDWRLEELDLSTGRIVKSVPHDDLRGVVCLDEGYALLLSEKIELYDDNDIKIGEFVNEDWNYHNGHKAFYMENGKYYSLATTRNGYLYQVVDFQSETSEEIFNPELLNEINYICYGPYIFTSDGMLKLNAEDDVLIPLTTWNTTDLQPAKYTFAPQEYYGGNDNNFSLVYNYQNGIAQVLFYSYDPMISYSNRTEIVIGGYNCYYDLPLNWAIYKFNTSQTEYRAITEEYFDDFSWNDNDPIEVRASLIQFFNDGNAPDIFYGEFFDYRDFFRSGMTLDLEPYLDGNSLSQMNHITPNIKKLMFDDEGHCYCMFSGYQFSSMCGSFDILGNKTNLPLDELLDMADELNISPIVGDTSVNLAENMIMYSVMEDEYSVEDYQTILNFCYEYGYETYPNSVLPMLKSTIHYNILFGQGFSCIEDFYDIYDLCQSQITVCGYPTIGRSIHPVYPSGMAAISSGTEHPDVCADILAELLDEEIQWLNVMSDFYPVNQTVLEEMCNYAVDHSQIPADNISYAGWLSVRPEIPEAAIEGFYDCIYSLDNVVLYDWGMEQIIEEEVSTYYTQNKPVDEIAEALKTRLDLYITENS